MNPISLFLLAVCAGMSYAETNQCSGSASQESCAACITTAKQCAWCSSENYVEQNRLRCDSVDNHVTNKCGDIEYPQDGSQILQNQSLRDGDRLGEAVQIQPQRIRVKLRPNTPMRIPFKFRLANDYPVDLYYLMDLSYSMKNDKENLGSLGDLIAAKMYSLTKDFRLGFGSFVDKPTYPLVIPGMENRCWQDPVIGCEKTYGFKNQLSLSYDTSRFAQRVKAALISGNYDPHEGSLEALMQAIVCETEIGWRPKARRIVVMTTDANFHIAGEGKFAGAVVPNDGKCNLVNNFYTKSLIQDYPSVSELIGQIEDMNMNVIFAVTSDQYRTYKQLAEYIDGSVTGILNSDSSNIVKLIEDNYKKITSLVRMRAESVDENMAVNFYTKCDGSFERQTHQCRNMRIGQPVDFAVEITVTSCPQDIKQRTKELVIRPVGYKEQLVLEVELICECDCEKPGNTELNSMNCSQGNGTMKCGECSCNSARFGKTCECQIDETAKRDVMELCLTSKDSSYPCSGRGACVCGQCQCFPRGADPTQTFSGEFCECDNYACSEFENQLCGGPGRGVCECGVCFCNKDFSGIACECEESQESCETDEGLVCNGHGECECGKCICSDQFAGPKCEDCLTCPGRCMQYKTCVLCQGAKPGNTSNEECDLCPDKIIKVPELDKETPEASKCNTIDGDSCVIFYLINHDYKGDTVLTIQTMKLCPESVKKAEIIGGVFGATVFIGLLTLLIWKLITHWLDTREYAKFEEERRTAKWDAGGNPIYQTATSTFQNPAYSNDENTARDQKEQSETPPKLNGTDLND